MSATSYGAFPRFFQTQDGRKHPVAVVGLSGVRATGLCGSGKVQTPLGDYVLRVETKGGQQLRADDVKFAIENIEELSALADFEQAYLKPLPITELLADRA